MAIGIGAAVGNALAAFLRRLLIDPMIKGLQGAMSMAFMSAFHGVNKLFPKQAEWLARKITEVYFVRAEEWAPWIAEYLERLTGSKISIDDIATEGFGITSKSSMEALGEKFLVPMLNLIMPGSPGWQKIRQEHMGVEKAAKYEGIALTPEDGLAGAERFMSANLQFQMSAWLLHVLGDMMSFGMFKSLKDLPNAISWSYGIGWLSWMVMGPMFRAGISAPCEKLLNRMYRPERLTNAQAIDAFYAGRKSAAELYKQLGEAGLMNEDIETLVYMSRKRFSESAMEYLIRRGWRSRDELIQYYREQSFTQEDAEALAERLLTKTKRELIEDIVKKAENLYKARVVEENDLRRYYSEIDFDQEEQDLAITALELDMIGTKVLTDTQIARLYQKGKLSKREALNRLEPRYADPKDASLFLELYPREKGG